jgi:ABC-type microcin C transport system permease subunit YejE
MLGELLRFLFYGELTRTIFIRRIKVPPSEEEGGQSDSPSTPEVNSRLQLIKFFSWILALVLIGCLVAIIGFSYQDKKIPDIIQITMSGIVGYFGGAICAFFGLQPPAK